MASVWKRWQDGCLKGLRQINPYVAGKQPNEPDMIKPNTNENAYDQVLRWQRPQNFDAQELRSIPGLGSGGALSGFYCKFGCITRTSSLQREWRHLIHGFSGFLNSGESVLFPTLTWFLQGLGRPLPSAFREIPLTADLRSIRQIILR